MILRHSMRSLSTSKIRCCPAPTNNIHSDANTSTNTYTNTDNTNELSNDFRHSKYAARDGPDGRSSPFANVGDAFDTGTGTGESGVAAALAIEFNSSVLSSTPLDDLLTTSWIRHHLYTIGADLVRLKLYQKLTSLIDTGGGSLIKNVVFDLTAFLKRELAGNNRNLREKEFDLLTPTAQLRDLIFFGSNVPKIDGHCIDSMYNIPHFRLLYITIGYMLISQRKELTEDVTEKILQIYMNSKNAYLSMLEMPKNMDESKAKILSLAKEYYKQVPINYRKLYNTKVTRSITLEETKDYKIVLPPLPRLHNRELLVKALIHKELYRAWIDSGHQFSQKLTDMGVDVNDSLTKNALKCELSLLDGLGDLYLARESSNLLYKFGGVPSHKKNKVLCFGTRTYNRLRVILSTNTLLSKLTVAYKLHQGLGDERVNRLLSTLYVPNVHRWEDPDFDDDDAKRYEQEFLADYFEQYIGALYLEQPEAAQSWILQIYENVLLLISEVHMLSEKETKKYAQAYNYRAWSVDVIGRNIWK